MTRAPQWEQWPFDHAWFFVQSQGEQAPGHVKITDQPTGGNNYWDIHVMAFDDMARRYFEDRDKKIGQPIKMPDGRILHVPYRPLDEEADMLIQRGGRHTPDSSPINLQTAEGIVMENTPRDYWNNLVELHIKRRKAEAPIPIDLGHGRRVQVAFEFFDAMCKDFIRRRGDMIAAGYWPELMMRDQGQLTGPKPVDGRPNALGDGVSVMGQQEQQAQAPQQQQQQTAPPQPAVPPKPSAGIAQPGIENQELV